MEERQQRQPNVVEVSRFASPEALDCEVRRSVGVSLSPDLRVRVDPESGARGFVQNRRVGAGAERSSEQLNRENRENEERDQHQQRDVRDRLEIFRHGVRSRFQVGVSIQDAKRTECAERFENAKHSEVQRHLRVGDERDDDNDEIEPVPKIPEIRALVENEAEGDDFHGGLECEDDGEDERQPADDFGARRLGVVQRVLHREEHGRDDDGEEDAVLENRVPDQLGATETERIRRAKKPERGAAVGGVVDGAAGKGVRDEGFAQLLFASPEGENVELLLNFALERVPRRVLLQNLLRRHAQHALERPRAGENRLNFFGALLLVVGDVEADDVLHRVQDLLLCFSKANSVALQAVEHLGVGRGHQGSSRKRLGVDIAASRARDVSLLRRGVVGSRSFVKHDDCRHDIFDSAGRRSEEDVLRLLASETIFSELSRKHRFWNVRCCTEFAVECILFCLLR